MTRYRKLKVSFQKGPYPVLGRILSSVKYRVGYIGLFETETELNLYIQLESNYQMSPSKLQKDLSDFGKILNLPEPFTSMEGTLVCKIGEFINVGRKTGSRVIDGRVDDSTNNSTNNVSLFINPLGKEDVSHISYEDFVGILKSKEDIEEIIESTYSDKHKASLFTRDWTKYRRSRRRLVRRWDELNSNGNNTLANYFGIDEMTYSSEEECDKCDKKEDFTDMKHPPEYDEDSESEDNYIKKYEIKEDIVKRLCFDFECERYNTEFLDEFEKLLCYNPHNGNVWACTNKGTFKHFDGKRWITSDKADYFETIIRSRLEKAHEFLNNTRKSKDNYGPDEMLILKMLNKMNGLRDNQYDYRKIVKNSVILSENNNRKIWNSSKKIKRVSEKENNTKYSWDDIL